MKTSTLKTAIQITAICVLTLTVFLYTKAIVSNVKTLYSLQPAGSGVTCFFDMIQ